MSKFYTITNSDGSTFEVEMIPNRHGLYAPDKFLDENNNRIRFNTNPNTGEEGEWIWLGTMGWVNIKADPQPEPEPGTIVFGGGGQIAGPYDPNYGNEQAAPPPTPNFTEADVYGLYQEFLNRNPRADGLAYWMEQANTMSLEDLRWNIANSQEALTGINNQGEQVVQGYYWANVGGSWSWLPYYRGEAPPLNAQYTSTGPDQPSGPPAGWTNPNTPTQPEPEPEPETLYTPDESMFFNGMFTAKDILGRDGGEIVSPYYNNARQNVLDKLAIQAADDGRTQNTAEEIRQYQNNVPGFSASGLFSPDYAALLKGMGL